MAPGGGVVFSSDWIKVSPPTASGAGYWLGDTGESSYATLEAVPGGGLVVPLQNRDYIGFAGGLTNWVYAKATRQMRAISYTGMSASPFGPGVTLAQPGTILALTEDGRMLLQGDCSDGVNRVYLAKGPDDVVLALAQGQAVPSVAGRTLGFMTSAGNDRGGVVVRCRLNDGDGNPFNDQSALFAGPATNVGLIALSAPGVLWGGPVYLSHSNHVMGSDILGGTSIYTLPDAADEPLVSISVSDVPRSGNGILTASTRLNALGQVATFFSDTSGTDLWLFNPGDGWMTVARTGENIQVGSEIITVHKIGFVANAGGGYPNGFTDDGRLVLMVNGTHILSAEIIPQIGFHWTGLLGPNWHAHVGNPPSSWVDANRVPRDEPPGTPRPAQPA